MKLQCCLFLVFLALFPPGFSNAQKLSPEMVALGIKLDRAFDRHMRGWTRERIVPVYPGENVLIENWTRSDRRVRISFVPHQSNEAASNAFANFASSSSPKTAVNNIGNEACQWGHANDIVFRRGHVTVFINSGVELKLLSVEDPELQSLNTAEQAATSKLVACFVDLVILGAFERSTEPESGSVCFKDLLRKGYISSDYFNRF
ncbi:MAG: hypothetical protein ND895_09815 [Pyrinomonadaceae bacterium]|nr:hypothetical protein [Pyrinomonadaceae bacterium]